MSVWGLEYWPLPWWLVVGLNFLESEYLSNVESPTIKNGLIKTYKYLLSHNNIAVSVSGGADSDDMIDVV